MPASPPSFDQELEQQFDALAYARSFRRQLDDIEARHELRTRRELAEITGEDAALIAQFEKWLEERARRSSTMSPPAAEQVPSEEIPPAVEAPPARGLSRLELLLNQIDQVMTSEFGFAASALPKGLTRLPTLHSDRAAFERSATSAARLDLPAFVSRRQTTPKASVFYHPGCGCLVHTGGLAAAPAGKQEDELVELLRQYAVVKWVQGFWMEQTCLGGEILASPLFAARAMRDLGLPPVDRLSPVARDLRGIEARLAVAEQGWQNWLWRYLLFKSHRPLAAQLALNKEKRARLETGMALPHLVTALVQFFNRFPWLISSLQELFGITFNLTGGFEILKFLFLEMFKQGAPALHQWMKLLEQTSTLDSRPAFAARSDPLAIIGQLIIMRLEGNLGALSVPAAGLVAFHVHSGPSPSEARPYQRDPNTRLALIAGLDGIRYSPEKIAQAAWERYRFESPAILRFAPPPSPERP